MILNFATVIAKLEKCLELYLFKAFFIYKNNLKEIKYVNNF